MASHNFLNDVLIKDSAPRGKFPLEKHLLVYCERMLCRVEPTKSFLAFVLEMLPPRDRVQTVRSFRRLTAARLKKKLSQLPELRFSIGIMDVDDFSHEIARCITLCKSSQCIREVEALLRDCVARAQGKLAASVHRSFGEKMAEVQRLFGLSEYELQIMAVALCYSLSRPFETFCDSIGVQEKRELIGILTGVPVDSLIAITGRTGRLVRSGILEVPSRWSYRDFYTIAQGIRDHLVGMGEDSLVLKYATPVKKARYSSDSFGLPEEVVRIALGLLRSASPCSILLHGVPGTGKSEFAKSLAMACGKQACFVAHTTAEDLRSGRVAVETVCAAHLASKSVVVVDEADELLNLHAACGSFAGQTKDSMAGKSWLNDFLDRCQAHVIWITNEIEAMEESSLRRFAYNIPFRRQSAHRRQEIWREHLRESRLQPLVTGEDVTAMSRKYRVGAAGIANALTHAARILPATPPDRAEVLGTLSELLASHERLTGAGTDGKLTALGTQYDPDAVNTDVPVETIVGGLKSFTALRRGERTPANLLFWGPPGTGKTALAQFLAQSLEKELIIRRASDLLSKWVGDTEHNIKRAFDQALHEDAILLLDEADSFFIDRARSQHSWETSQTNELLTQMENHQGILVCCTNLLETLDHAVLRRFAWKVKFQEPTPEGRQRIYRRYFDHPDNPAPADCLNRVSHLDHLTPGDIKAVWVRVRLQAPADWNHAAIVQSLADEVSYRSQKNIVAGFQFMQAEG